MPLTPLPKGLQSAKPLLRKATSEALAPDPELLVSEWADRFRIVSSKASARPGPWYTSRVPYMREIMDAMSLTHPCVAGDFMKGTQIAGSEGLYNAIGYAIDVVPCSIMLVMPTVDTAKLISHQRLQPMLEESPSLAKKLAPQRSRDTSNTALRKDFPGGMLLLRGANSGPGLRNAPIRFLAMDEIDAYPDDVDGEGDPCVLAEKRTESYGRRAKKFSCSSPKIKGKSRIDRRYNRGSRAHYYVPCPHCEHLQVLRWGQIKYEMEKRRELMCAGCGTVSELHGEAPRACEHCDAKVTPEDIRETADDVVAEAWYECERCTARIDEHHKTAMLEEWPTGKARHIHEAPGPCELLDDDDRHPHAIWAWIGGKMRRVLPRFRRPLSWQVAGLYSPLGWFSWRDAVAQFLEAQKGGYDEETGESLMQVFENTVLGEPFEVKGERPKQDILKLRAEAYELGQVPAGALVLIAAVDVQGDRLEVKVKGYGRGMESWLVDYQVIHYAFGNKQPTTADWDRALQIRDKGYPHAGGGTLQITAMAVDSGAFTQEVYGFCRKWAHRHIFAIKGVPQNGKPILGRPTAQDVNYDGKIVKEGVQMWPIGTVSAKEQIYGRLDIAEPGPGYMHFPKSLPDSYYDGLTAEKMHRKRVKGADVIEWVKVVERNEPLDLEVYCLAAAIYAGVQRVNWDALEAAINPGQRDLFKEAARVQTSAPAEAAPPQPLDEAVAVTVNEEPAPAPPRKNWVTGF